MNININFDYIEILVLNIDITFIIKKFKKKLFRYIRIYSIFDILTLVNYIIL